jgi:hypothetical protein
MWTRLVLIFLCAAASSVACGQDAGPVTPNPAYAGTTVEYLFSLSSISPAGLCTDDVQIQNIFTVGNEVSIQYSIKAAAHPDCALNPPLTLSLELGPFAPGQYLVRASGDYRGAPLTIITTPLTVLQAPAPIASYQGLWWNAPAGSESGWGINLAHQGDVIFATWFTYNGAGDAWWLSMTARRTTGNTYSGALIETNGPPFDAVPFPPMGDPSGATAHAVGAATLTFSDDNNGTFAYTVNGISQTKAITKEVFGIVPNCVFEPSFDANRAVNVTDLWWADPPGSEAGWGLNISEQAGATAMIWYVTWFTYDHNRAPAWFSVTANFDRNSGTFKGDLYRYKGPPFNSVPFASAGTSGGAVGTKVGSATFINYSGASKSFSYTLDGVTQTKTITRQVFAAPRATCR